MAKRMTQAQMVEKLMALQAGSKIEQGGKMYDVLAVKQHPEMKTCKTTIALLEEGKPETYMVEGKYLAADKMIEMSNVQRYEWYAQSPYMDWTQIA